MTRTSRTYCGLVNDEDPAGAAGPLVPDTIPCIDCGGTCYLTSWPPEDGWHAGDLATYRCRDCLDRWDTVVPGDDGTDPFTDL